MATTSPHGLHDLANARRLQAWSFRLGAAAVTVGVALHVPMFLSARHDGYMLVGMSWSPAMIGGMALIAVGLVAVVGGLFGGHRRPPADCAPAPSALDDAPLGRAHLGLLATLTVAIAIDTQKPFTFTFVLPGIVHEYGLKAPAHPQGSLPVALLPFVGILGTVLGSLLWGYLADRVGRRPTILFSGVIFIATSACGAMPAFSWNLVMCFAMGLGVGGLLPIAYSLLCETIPARRRAELIVLVAGMGTATGFLLTSGCADLLVPTFGWRIMWFVGVPTGVALIALSNAIPESPRFLLARGRLAEAQAVMARFGLERRAASTAAARPTVDAGGPFGGALRRLTLTLTLYGLAWGLANFGFLVWLPIDLAAEAKTSMITGLLAKSALLALPASVVVAWLYARWSAKGTLALAGALTASSLIAFATYGNSVADRTGLLTGLLVLFLVSMWAVVSVLAPYGSEIYPTRVRAAGAGIVAGATKLGGVLALAMAVLGVAPPGVRGAALLAAVPTLLAVAAVIAVGIETRARTLEDITLAEEA